jgi:hypothetical protein
VANFAPKRVFGQVKEPHVAAGISSVHLYNVEGNEARDHAIQINAPIQQLVLAINHGDTLSLRESKMFRIEGSVACMELRGNLAQDDVHDDGANSVIWDLEENPISKEGILRSFRGVILLFCRRGEAFWMDVSVKPAVKFSLDPQRLFTKRLMGTKDEPILLDGHSTLGDLACLSHDKFDSEDFPWQNVLNLSAPLGGNEA